MSVFKELPCLKAHVGGPLLAANMFYDPARLIVLQKMPGGLQQEMTKEGYLTTAGTM
jgi:hypothetical protein